MAIDKVFQSRREEIMGIAQRYGAKNVRVFGSRARGDACPNSDFDILVTVGEHTSLLDIIAIKQDLEDLLSSTVHVVTEDAISPYIREEVLKQAIALPLRQAGGRALLAAAILAVIAAPQVIFHHWPSSRVAGPPEHDVGVSR